MGNTNKIVIVVIVLIDEKLKTECIRVLIRITTNVYFYYK